MSSIACRSGRLTCTVKDIKRSIGDRESDRRHLLGGSGLLAENFNDTTALVGL